MNDVENRIVLASGSPRRRELLAQIGVRFEVVPADIDESVGQDETPGDYTARLAVEKTEAVLRQCGAGRIVLGADTTVALGNRILGKPEDEDDAIAMLQELSGRVHQVFTTVAVADREGRIDQLSNVTNVEFAPLEERWIRGYVRCGEPMDKAGSYGIQGWAAPRIRRIEGSHSSVMGLPLHETAVLLERAGLDLLPLD